MSHTYSQIHVQLVFAVKYRELLIERKWKNRLYRHITDIVQRNKHKLLIINGMPDHIHILVGLRPRQSVSELMQEIKGSSSKWINDNHLVKGKFEWQNGYGAFSYSKPEIWNVIQYIENQEEHHQTKTFKEEYIEMLNEMEIEYEHQSVVEELV
jgi:REP element-mobilizing transposase RayT